MAASVAKDPVGRLFAGKDPVTRAIYASLLKSLRTRLGKSAVAVDPKKTCIHFNAGPEGAAFLGVHIRKSSVLITIKSESETKNKRVRRALKASRSRWYNDVVLQSEGEVDEEFLGWVEASYGVSV